MNKLSVIIPSYRELFLQETIDSILKSAEEDIEIIVCLDNCDPERPLKQKRNVIVLKTEKKLGMRECINEAFKLCTGKFLMKSDAHCLYSKGFDVELKKNCEENWVSIPRRYSLDPIKWTRSRIHNYIDYVYISPPFIDGGRPAGMKGLKWRGPHGADGPKLYLENERKDILIDEIIAFQGSCWFMHADHFKSIGGLDSVNFGSSGREALEISFKTWLTGGKVVRNKNAWYAHLMQGRTWRLARGYKPSQYDKSVNYLFKLCFNDWVGKTKDFKWLIDRFGPMDEWPQDWYSNSDIEIFKNG